MASSTLITADIDLFGIELAFRPHSEAPSRIFRAMSALIESFEYTDHLLSRSIANRLQPILTPQDIEDLLVKEEMTSSTPMILRIKKPDFLRESMWEFQFAGHIIPARCLMRAGFRSFGKG